MEGAQILRPEMDVYAFGICCWEILKMGAVPWPDKDDGTIRHFVLGAYPLLHFSGSDGNTPPSWIFHQTKTRGPSLCPPILSVVTL
jgi:hypothetical protein